MMYKCCDCGHVFDDSNVKLVHECMGECHGFPAYETYYACPVCGGSFDDARQCNQCGEWFLRWELSDGRCDDCICESETVRSD